MSGSRLRILIVGINYTPESSGIAPYTTRMAEGLAQRGHRVRVLTSFPHYPDWKASKGEPHFISESGVQVSRLRHYVPSWPSPIRRLLFEVTFGVKVVCTQWHRPDVVVCVSPAFFSTVLAVARIRMSIRRPAGGVIVQDLYSKGVAETGAAGRWVSRVMKIVESSVLRWADGVSVIHPRFKSTIVGDLRVPAGRVTVIRNWTHISTLDDVDTAEVRARLGWGPKDTVVLHSGAMGVKQALTNVIEAGRLADERCAGVRFVLLGNGSQRAQLQERAREVKSVVFLDAVSDEEYGCVLRAADVLLVNERQDVSDMAVPSKLTSYFAAGRPILAATNPGSTTAEDVVASGAGRLVEPSDPGGLLAAVIDLASDPDRERYGRAGLEYSQVVTSEAAALGGYDRWVKILHSQRQDSRI